MSWESTAEYYRLANELVRERLGGLHSARLVLASVDFAEVEQMQVTGEWERAGELLAGAAKSLEAAGADFLVLCTNTMHKVADQIETAVSIPLLHLGDATAVAVKRAGLRTVGLLGTAFTMEQSFYRDRLARHGLTVLVPSPPERAEVHRVIYEVAGGREQRSEVPQGRPLVLSQTEVQYQVGPMRTACIANHTRQTSRTSVFPPALLSPNSGIIRWSSVCRSASLRSSISPAHPRKRRRLHRAIPPASRRKGGSLDAGGPVPDTEGPLVSIAGQGPRRTRPHWTVVSSKYLGRPRGVDHGRHYLCKDEPLSISGVLPEEARCLARRTLARR